MTTLAQFLAIANSQVGYVETGGSSGHNGNITKYWADLDQQYQGQSWCAEFVDWCWYKAGRPFVSIDAKEGYVNCNDAMIWAKAHGLWDESGHYSPGDTVIFDWANDGVGDHTGIVVADDGKTLSTIEGNTSPGDGGSQANGGGVYRRQRPHGSTVLGVLKTSSWFGAPAAPDNPTAASTITQSPEDIMAPMQLVQVPGDTKVFVVFGIFKFYLEIPHEIADLHRMGTASVGPDGRLWPIGQDTLDRLIDATAIFGTMNEFLYVWKLSMNEAKAAKDAAAKAALPAA